jgi:integrase
MCSGLVDPLGAPIRPKAYSDRFAVLCHKAGVPVVRLHSVRHTLALIGHRAGIGPADMAALLGHTLAVHLSAYIPATERGAGTTASGLGVALAGVR